jgi:hypothetical protein
MIATMYA